MRRGVGEIIQFCFAQRSDTSRRAAVTKKAALQNLAFRDQTGGAPQHQIMHYRAVEYHRAAADQTTIADSAAVQHHAMADGGLVADVHGVAAGPRSIVVGAMDHRAVLHAGARADCSVWPMA